MTRSAEFWNTVYDNDTAPWVIGQPQPAIVALERQGAIRGRVLDPGAGAGEHTILLTRLGYDVTGLDLSPSAVDYARGNAESQGVPQARFEVADALELGRRADLAGDPAGSAPVFDTVVDSALFHVFGAEPELRAAYVRSLGAVVKPGGVVHMLALSTAEPGIGPRIGAEVIRESFGAGWQLESLEAARYRGRAGDATPEQIGGLAVSPEGFADFAAWITRVRRL
ncbi:class I SAM-dependent methyltransferase [Nocardia crassostreae]|uniref:class I SAM-dependent methyltransferase n=1 Tax=Nocardia crassostreae TaxID=53428 RepID=UPI00082F0F11|nr:class I SAM-dependent methyltransferase [Nocardia crassostreae]